MIQYISNFFKIKSYNYQPFNKQYRDGYNRLWINNLRNYSP